MEDIETQYNTSCVDETVMVNHTHIRSAIIAKATDLFKNDESAQNITANKLVKLKTYMKSILVAI